MRGKNIVKVFHNRQGDVTALHHVSFDFTDTGMYMIVGPSGCGKSTLLQILAGNDKDYEGTVEQSGKVVLMEQDIVLLEAMSVYEQLSLISKDNALIETYMKKFQIENLRNKKVKTLSIGQKKRVQLLSCLLLEPDVLLCDEPTTGLDHTNITLIMDTLKEMSKHCCVVVVTHETKVADEYGDVWISMEKGEIQTIKTINKKKPLEPKKKSHVQNTIASYLKYHFSDMKSRPMEWLFLVFLFFSFLFTLYGGLSYFTGVSTVADHMNIWKSGKNVIYAQPLNQGNDIGYGYLTYDTFDLQQIQTLLENTEGIIGYNLEFQSQLYCPYRRFNYNDVIEITDELKKKEAKGEKLNLAEQYLMETLNTPEFHHYEGKKDYPFANDYRSVLYAIEDASYSFDEEGNLQPFNFTLKTENSFNYEDVELYHSNPNKTLPLYIGKMPEKENEILISKNFAKSIMAQKQCANMEDLVQSSIELEYEVYVFGSYSQQDTIKKEVPFIIAGILNYEAQSENQAIVYSSYYEDTVFDEMNWNQEEIQFKSISFLIDPAYSAEQLASNMNQILNTKYSQFLVYENQEGTVEAYQNSSMFYGYLCCLSLAILILVLGYFFYFRHRNQKEAHLLKKYNYDVNVLLIEKYAIIGCTALLVFCLALPTIIEYVNAYAITKQYPPILEYNHVLLLVIAIVCFLVFFLSEKLMLVIKTKE